MASPDVLGDSAEIQHQDNNPSHSRQNECNSGFPESNGPESHGVETGSPGGTGVNHKSKNLFLFQNLNLN